MIFTRSFVIVAMINFMVMMAYYLLFIVCGPYAIDQFKASPSMAGLVAGLMLVGCLAGRFTTSGILHVVGFKRILLAGIVVFTGSMLLYQVATNLPALMVARFVSGLGVGWIGTVTATLVAHLIPANRLGQGIGYFSLSTILALALGPFLGMLMTQYLSYPAIFGICSGFGFISLFIAINLKIPEDAVPKSSHQTSAFNLQNYVDKKVLPLSSVVLVVAACYGALQAFIPVYARELNMVHSASFFFLFYAIIVFVTRPWAGKIFDVRGANYIAYPALVMAVLGFIVLGIAQSTVVFLLSGILLGVSIGNFQSTAQSASMKLVPKTRIGQATSTYFIFLDLGIGIGPYLLGTVVPLIGYQNLFFILAGICALCVPMYYYVHGKRRVRPLVGS